MDFRFAVTCEVGFYDEDWYGITKFPDRTEENTSDVNVSSANICINKSIMPDNDNFRKSIIAHEIGHLMNLNDNPFVVNPNDSLMHYDRDRTVVFSPQPFDINNILFTYLYE